VSELMQALRQHAAASPQAIALDPLDGTPLTAAQLVHRIEECAARIPADWSPERPVAVQLGHGTDEVVWELALQLAGIPLLSLPGFFTADQARHAMVSSGAQAIIRDRGTATFACSAAQLPRGTARITFSSGSTGTPKGICLSRSHLEQTARAVVDSVGTSHAGRHLALLPAGILLETVAGLFATLLAGGTYLAPAAPMVGMANPFRPDFGMMLNAIMASRATSLILVPEYLAGLVAEIERSGVRPAALTLVAVGGARVGAELVEHARRAGLPVRQGYGLTECGSVVTLQQSAADPAGSAGTALHGTSVTIAADGEIMVAGPLCLGAIGGAAPHSPFATGDLGRIDDAGQVWIEGRKSNLIITSFGRNIAPEWLEEALLAQPQIAQCMVYGDGLPAPGALLVPSTPDADLAAGVAAVNAALPAYARIGQWSQVAHFTPHNGLLTGNGRLCRSKIAAMYLDKEPAFFDQLEAATVRERLAFLSIAQVRAGLAGTISLSAYLDYLNQAFHHVSHTVPLMQAARARLAHRPRMVAALDEYIAEETGHEEWILADIAAAGGEAERARHSQPKPATAAMIAHAYHRIAAGNPICFFGMVYVLESVSVALASQGASSVAHKLGLPPEAFTYLTSHGALDQSHLTFFADLVNSLQDDADRAAIITMAREIFALFGAMFAAIELEPVHAAA